MDNQTFILTLFALSTLAVIWVHWIEPNWFYLRHKTVRVKRRIENPFTVLHLSDLHFTKPRRILGKFFERLSKLDVDFVFITGDLIDSPKGIEPCVSNLKKLKSRKGIYAVLGNHDYRSYPIRDQITRLITKKYYGRNRPEAEQLKKALREAGIHVLENQNVPVSLAEGEEAILVGVDDPVTGRANLDQAFRGIENGVLRLALIHSPAPFPSLERRGVDIAFAGHTHGGQIRLPGIGPLPYAYRLEPIIDSTNRYGFVGLVSRGLGANPTIRLRFFCRPEAILVRVEGQ